MDNSSENIWSFKFILSYIFKHSIEYGNKFEQTNTVKIYYFFYIQDFPLNDIKKN